MNMTKSTYLSSYDLNKCFLGINYIKSKIIRILISEVGVDMKKLIYSVIVVGLVYLSYPIIYEMLMIAVMDHLNLPEAVVEVGIGDTEFIVKSDVDNEKDALVQQLLKEMSYDIIEFKAVSEHEILGTMQLKSIDLVETIKENKALWMQGVVSHHIDLMKSLINGEIETFNVTQLSHLLQHDVLVKIYDERLIDLSLTRKDGIWYPLIDEQILSQLLGLTE